MIEKRLEKVVYLHIGLEKTGSTSLQRSFFNNYKVLESQGCKYPVDFIRYPNHVELTTSYCDPGHIVKLRSMDRASFRRKLREYLKINSELDIVFSNEHLSSRLLSQEGRRDLVDDLSSSGHRVVGICYLRSPKKWLVSAYGEAVKSGYRGDFNDYLSLKKNVQEFDFFARDIGWVLNGWRSIFGDENFRVFSFEKAVEHGLISHFCQKISLPGLEKKFSVNERVENVSLSHQQLEIIRLFNKVSLDCSVFVFLRKVLVKFLPFVIKGSGSILGYCDKDGRQLEKYHFSQKSKLAKLGFYFWD